MPYTEYDYLAHHGVKGMKWGVRRYRNYDGTLTSAGKERYSSEDDVPKSLKKIYEKREQLQKDLDSLDKEGTSSPVFKKRYLWSDTYTDEKFLREYGRTKEDAVKETKKATEKKLLRLSYREKLKKGEDLTEEEAKLCREDNIKKALLVAAVTGVTVYAAYQTGAIDTIKSQIAVANGSLPKKSMVSDILEQDLGASEVDHVIRQGFDFYRMSGWRNEDFSRENHLYVTATETDREIYRGWLRDWHGTGKRFETALRAAKDLKVAGSRSQRKMLSELLEDEDYFDTFCHRIMGEHYKDPTGFGREYIAKYGKEEFMNQTYKSAVYDLVKKDSTISKRFFEFAKQKGYDALTDDNDRGTMSYSPMILLDPGEKVKRVKSKRVTAIGQATQRNKLRKKGVYLNPSETGLMMKQQPHKRTKW